MLLCHVTGVQGTDRHNCCDGHHVALRGSPNDAIQWPEEQIYLSVLYTCLAVRRTMHVS